ncbi:MAG: hypothetical protein IKU40_10455 [Clostridia bacterium]|nr:hypothetical protein [Clostridia bacterium]
MFDMFVYCFGNVALGLVVGLIFSLLFVSCDAGWKKILSLIGSTGVSGGGLFTFYSEHGFSKEEILISLGCICCAYILMFFAFLFFMCKIMKDKDDKDILRIRDIMLGQRNYIKKYYEKREKEIDTKLNIEELEKRENEITKREEECSITEQRLILEKEELEKDRDDFDSLTQDKLKVNLPVNKKLIITRGFLEVLPSYVERLSSFIEGINRDTELFFGEHETVSYEDFKVFCFLIAVQIQEQLFGKNNKDVRVHFRCYDKNKKGYVKFISVINGKENGRQLTVIPYDKANMIKKSYECKRALIKSHNMKYHYESKNSTTWTEYMTGTFYNITCNSIPCFSFGISVKNATVYRDLFNFLNYCKFETYVYEVIEKFNEKYCIETILY